MGRILLYAVDAHGFYREPEVLIECATQLLSALRSYPR
ncbi:hypothetical protein CCHR01_17905 [Colletotrichum chrysophilum]|uniref:Uncharacterized protein n=1 Tax=Colletotrichum chrysophilum TaxID=1836956 RepID=A0AAD9A3E8_9PEZI|nr:hypothetical protein CCHR01_17905 [Colletotrichum chrysophilum]